MKHNYRFGLLLIISIFVSSVDLAFAATEKTGYRVPKDPPKASYTVEAKIDLETETLSGSGRIELINNGSKPLTVIAFRLLKPGTLSVTMDSRTIHQHSSNRNILFYSLPAPIQPGTQMLLDIKFSLTQVKLNKQGAYASSYWIPTLWWDGVPHVNDYKVSISAPNGHALAVTGRKNDDDGYFYSTNVRECGIYLGKGMISESANVGDVRITAFFTEAGAEGGRYCLQTAIDAVQYYKDWLGFYPFDYLYVLPGGTGVWGGYPMATGMVRIHGLEKFRTVHALHWKWITAHEIGHQYWGEYVLDGDYPQWLWIGLGVYADREYTMARGIGSERQIRMMNRFPKALQEGYETILDLTQEKRQRLEFDYNSMIIHGKGFSFISALDLTIGRETFQRAYKRTLSKYGGKRLGWQDFQKICEEESGENLRWFFNQWVRSSAYLRYKITSRSSVQQGDKWLSRITVQREGTLSMQVPVQAVFEDGTSQTKFTDRTMRENVLEFESDSRLWKEVIDPEKRLALLTEPLPLPKGSPADLIRNLPWTGARDEGLRIYKAAIKQSPEDQRSWFKLGLVLFDGGYHKEAYNAFAKLVALKAEGLYGFAAYTWMGQLQDLLGNREQAIKSYRKALELDENFNMQHSQFGLVLNRSWVEKLLKEPFKW